MTLTDEQLELIESALQRFGVTGLARKIGATRSTFYEIRRRGRGLTPDKLEKIQQLMLSKAKEMPGNAPGVAIEPTQGQISSDAGLLRLLYQELPKLSETNLAKVYRYVIELQIKQESE